MAKISIDLSNPYIEGEMMPDNCGTAIFRACSNALERLGQARTLIEVITVRRELGEGLIAKIVWKWTPFAKEAEQKSEIKLQIGDIADYTLSMSEKDISRKIACGISNDMQRKIILLNDRVYQFSLLLKSIPID